jgi:hypothetical protein
MPISPSARQSADRIDRKRFAAHKASRDANSRHTLKHPPQTIAIREALVPGWAETLQQRGRRYEKAR